MAKIELVRFLWEMAGEALEKAENVSPDKAKAFLDEAEEILALAISILNRSVGVELNTWEAA